MKCEGCNEREAIVKVLTLDRSDYWYLCEVCSELTLRYREKLDDNRINKIDKKKYGENAIFEKQ